jgi:hypothetical protein
MAQQTPTTDAVFIPELWSPRTYDALYQKSVVRDIFEFESYPPGSDTTHYGQIPKLTAVQIVPGTSMTPAAVTPTQLDLIIDQFWGVAFALNDQTKIQVLQSLRLKERYAKRAGEALADKMDLDGLGLYSSMSQSVTAAADITDANIREAIQLLDEASAPESDRFLVIRPSQKKTIMGLDKFVLFQNTGDNTMIKRGIIGEIYGVQVKVTNKVISNSSFFNNFMCHKEYALFGVQEEINIKEQEIILDVATNVVVRVLYGYVETRDDFAVRIPTSN